MNAGRIKRKSIFSKLKTRGFKAVFRNIYSYLYDLYFDRKYQLETNTWVPVSKLDTDETARTHAVLYQPTRALPLKRLFKHLNLPKAKTLVDIGSGKGRVMLIAAQYGFKKVKGIELSKNLCDIATKNFKQFKRKTKLATEVEIINANAATYTFKDDDDVIFLYNPFDDVVLNMVLDNISRSLEQHPRSIWMIYANALYKDLIEQKMCVINQEKHEILEFNFMVYQVKNK